MKIGLLLCDEMSAKLKVKHSSYTHMFELFLTQGFSDFSLEVFNAKQGILPEDHTVCDFWLISGSQSAVYDKELWMKKLQIFILKLFYKKQKTIGFCFGHQIMAQALGGVVKKFDQGWDIGVSNNEVVKQKPWMKPFKRKFNMLVSHQDQVEKLPKSAELIVSNAFCKYYCLQYENHFLSFQGHPEFNKAYLKDAIIARNYTDELVKKAEKSMVKPINNHLIMNWLISFLSYTE